jgi:CarboxypepD_reg-like domain
MMVKTVLFLMGCVLLSTLCLGQVDSSIYNSEIRSKVVDKKTKKALPFATVYNLNRNHVAETNGEGFFTIKFERLTDTLITYYLGYKTDTTTIGQVNEAIFLLPIQNLLAEIEISDFKKSTIINHPKITPIKFVTSDSLGFLLSERMIGFRKKYELEVYHYTGVSLKKIPIDHGDKVDIFKNCQNQIFLHIDDECIKIAFENQQLSLIEKMIYSDYQSIYGHCMASIEGQFVYQLARWNNLEKNYFLVDPKEENSKLFKSIIYEERLQSYKQDMGFIDYGKNVSTMEITDIGQNTKIRRIQAASFLLEKIIHKNNTVNYFFSQDTSFVFFNFDEKQIEIYDLHGDLTKTITNHPIFRNKHKTCIVLNDDISQKFYFVYDTHNDYVISEIDIETTRLLENIALNLVYFKSIDIVKGNIFSLGRNSIIGPNALFYKRLD